jgi:hypothetical protein
MIFDFFALVGCAAASLIHAEEGQERAAHDMALYRQLGEESYRQLFGPRATPKRKTYECAGCGAPLFGVLNENCQYCKRPAQC